MLLAVLGVDAGEGGQVRSQANMQLGEQQTLKSLSGIKDSTIKITGTCGVGEEKFTCKPPLAQHGISPRWFNGTLPMTFVKTACKPLKSKGARKIALVNSGGCSLVVKAQHAADAGFAAAIVIDTAGKKSVPKSGDADQHLAVPTVTVTGEVGSMLTTALEAGKKTTGEGKKKKSVRVGIALKALKKSGTFWKGPTTLYQEAMKHKNRAAKLVQDACVNEGHSPDYDHIFMHKCWHLINPDTRAGARQAYDLAIELLTDSVALEPRAAVALHELANSYWDSGRPSEVGR